MASTNGFAVKKPKRTGSSAGRASTNTRVQADENTARPSSSTGSRFARMTAEEARAEGKVVQDISPSLLIPNPFNDLERSDQHAQDAEGLLQSVAADGVRIALAAFTRAAFDASWPGQIPADQPGEYVLQFGHRRRAAALQAGCATVPVIVDDSDLQKPDRGLLGMYQENDDRLGLSPLADARLLNRFIEDLGMSQNALGEMLGKKQPTISRRLNLLLLCEPLQVAVSAGEFNGTEAASLAAKLPYGRAFSWQRNPDELQETAERQAEQLRAYELIKQGSGAINTVTDRIIKERESRATAAAQGVEIINPIGFFGDSSTAQQHRVYIDVSDTTGLVAAIDDHGALAYYSRELVIDGDPIEDTGTADDEVDDLDADSTEVESAHENPEPGSSSPAPAPKKPANAAEKKPSAAKPKTVTKQDAEDKARIEASNKRREAAKPLALHPPAKDLLAQTLIDQYAYGIHAHASGELALELAEQWGYVPADDLDPAQARSARAWALALAGYELAAAHCAQWSKPQQLYIQLLRDRTKYEPTPWETKQLDQIA
ncbi:ParB/RepB/Spo0J family partition protein [Mycobacteroides abscessus]|uniref:ParB/RepB/Spo0J family partition protein n=1 Tax=Mycobacteroides abscessus TaxID=36809 RepID=UPI00210585BA|nr:ParB/RepB/Spo0J family partition protein [Mycobacteroides abscessus]